MEGGIWGWFYSAPAEQQNAIISGAVGILGAIAGSVVSVASTEWFNSRAARKAAKLRDRSLAYAVFYKLNQIYSDLMLLRKHFSEAKSKFLKDQADYESRPPEYAPDGIRIVRLFFLHSYMEPYTSTLDYVQFSTDEMTALISVGGPKLLNEINSLDRRHKSIVQSIEHYAAQRNAIRASLTLESAEGTKVKVAMNRNDPKQTADLAALEQLLDQTSEFADTVAAEAYHAIKSLAHADTRPFGRKFRISLPDPQGVKVSIRAADGLRHRERWWQIWLAKRPEVEEDLAA